MSKLQAADVLRDYSPGEPRCSWSCAGLSRPHSIPTKYDKHVRVSVMGPYVRASAFNEDSSAREVEVKAYPST